MYKTTHSPHHYWDPVVTDRWESWTIKKAEHQRMDAFELWCWRRLLRVPWTARRSIQSILKGINPEYSLEGLMLKLKLQYFGHLMQRIDSLEKALMLEQLKAGGERDDRGWDGWMASPTQWIWIWASSGRWWRTREVRRAAIHGVSKSWTRLSNWTELNSPTWRTGIIALLLEQPSCYYFIQCLQMGKGY